MAEKGGHWVKSAGGGMSFVKAGGGGGATVSSSVAEMDAATLESRLLSLVADPRNITREEWKNPALNSLYDQLTDAYRWDDIKAGAAARYRERQGTSSFSALGSPASKSYKRSQNAFDKWWSASNR